MMLSPDDKGELKAFAEKVKAAQNAIKPELEQDRAGWAIGVRYASEFSSAVIVGGLIGYGIDHFAKTAPWFLLIGLGFGFIAGIRNLLRAAKEISGPIKPGSGEDIGFDTDDE